jgi:hypothetical protein
VASLFAVCGALSAACLISPAFPDRLPIKLPIPFVLICAALFMRTTKVILAIPFMIATWAIAYSAAYMLGLELGFVLAPLRFYIPIWLLPGCVSGFIGGFGLALCVSICYSRLLSRMFGGALIGTISGLAFAPWLWFFCKNGYSPLWLLIGAFAIWQSVEGTYLYAICTSNVARKEAQLEDKLP